MIKENVCKRASETEAQERGTKLKIITFILLVVFTFVLGLTLKYYLFPVSGKTMEIHIYSRTGDISKVHEILTTSQHPEKIANAIDDSGMTPLMLAVQSPGSAVELAQLLIDSGAKVNAESRGSYYDGQSVLSHAVSAGDPATVALLLNHGADIHYQHHSDYDAIIDAMHGRDITRDNRLIALLDLLIRKGADVNGRTKYCESGIRVASNMGRFDAVAMLLDAGADEKELGWTPLMKAIALGTQEEINTNLNESTDLETRDSWHRTPWLLAIQTGDIKKAELLRKRGADINAKGRSGKPPLFYAINNGHHEMLRWLLSMGMDPEQHDESGTTALIEAAEYGDPISIDLLLANGAKVDRGKAESTPEYDERMKKILGDLDEEFTPKPDMPLNDDTALYYATNAEAAVRLLTAGADPARLSREARRQIQGFKAESTDEFRLVSRDDYLRGRYRRFGQTNPELTNEPFWQAMVRSGVNAWQATQHFKDSTTEPDKPVWCADRFGQSLTLLPDGRIVEIGGEHEDWYDPDFAIYNDVIVHDGRGGIRIYAYPKSVFPPTDFHTATLVDQYIYIIGSLGYDKERQFGTTPVYRLHLDDLHIEAMTTTGDMPGWIYDHRAELVSDSRIHISGGKVCTLKNGEEQHIPNLKEYVLDLEKMAWSAVDL